MFDADRKPRILFVDDDPDLLNGMRHALRRDRKRWDLAYASSGQAALDTLEHFHADMVVTDMRMPGIDGAELLSHIAHRFPATLRFRAVRRSLDEMALRAIPYTHQWIAKPIAKPVLIETIERSMALLTRIHSPEVREWIAHCDLPAAPANYQALQAALRVPEPDLDPIAACIEQDPVLTGRILQWTNSGFFGRRQEIRRVRDALTTLGLRLLSEMVLVSGVFHTWKEAPEHGPFGRAELLEHSLLVARQAALMAADLEFSETGVWSAALLHDIGYLILADRAPEQLRALENRLAGGEPTRELELEIVGCGHGELGGALLQAWGLPFAVVEAVVHHQDPENCVSSGVHLAGLVHLAGAIVRGSEPNPSYLASSGLAERYPLWKSEYSQARDQAA
ncbi:MAG: HDOD domain-containing protein [Planctomycetota bacterium]